MAPAVVVGVTKKMFSQRFHQVAQWPLWSQLLIALVSGLIVSLPLTAAILPEDRADVLYHRYQGGGVTIDGPSILARKQIGQKVSLSANYYVDFVSSASIDVETYASEYTEERTEYSLGMDYLHDNTTLNFGFANSEESDYSADTLGFNVSHDMFGDLTTVSLGYTHGSDVVRQNDYDDGVLERSIFMGDTKHDRFRLGLTQILTKNLVVGLSYETITDEGFLNNPYRQVYYIDLDTQLRRSTSENYPKTRTSTALGIRAKYYLPWRAAFHGEFRGFSDSWDIAANMYDIGFTQPIKKNWVLDFHYRFYSQTAASFYSDLFYGEQLYMARDKELATYTTTTIGGSLSYEFLHKGWWKFDKASLNFSFDAIQFDYEDFYDQRNRFSVEDAEQAPAYSFSANVYRLYFSVWY